MKSLFDMFTNKMKEAIDSGIKLALYNKNPELEITHIIWALLVDSNSILNQALSKLSVNLEQIMLVVRSNADKLPKISNPTSQVNINISKYTIASFKRAEGLMKQQGDSFLAIDTWILANLDDDVFKNTLLKEVNRVELKKELEKLRKGEKIQSQTQDENLDSLGKFGVDLTLKALNGELDPIIGREEEIHRVIQILSRKTKNNPILLGEPGTGKTAIAEGLAQKIIKKDVPLSLQDKKIVALDMSAIVAGAKYRGEFEDRLKSVIKEVKNSGQIILFIDEIHTIVTAGGGEGSIDAANILKPALSRGEIRTIGATTLKEYRKYFEKDAALQRRFQPVNINEPDTIDALQMLRGIKEKLESHHNVNIQDSALVAAVKFSDRYITDRFLPDKAIDLIDEAAAELKIQIESNPLELSRAKIKIARLQVEKEALLMDKSKKNDTRLKEIEKDILNAKEEQSRLNFQFQKEKEVFDATGDIKTKIDELKREAEIAKRNSDFNKQAKIEYGEIPKLRKEEEALNKKWEEMLEHGTLLKNSVDEEMVAKIVSKWTGIPVARMLKSEKDKILNIEAQLKKEVVGQDEAIKSISKAIKRNKAGLNDIDRPIGSFIFLGSTGVGKTQTAKSLAKFLFDTTKAIVRLDMSEYMEKHSVSRLIGAPAGYIGYDDGGQLTEAIRRKPYSIVLFDEIEKAHKDVFNILLQILDEGNLTDNKGVNVNFKNTIIILTSNIASSKILEFKSMYDKKRVALDELKLYFRPEFLNRLDDIIIFNTLDEKSIKNIVDILLLKLQNKLLERNITLSLSEDAKYFIANKGYDIVYGARPLKRAISNLLEDEIATMILEDKLKNDSKICVSTAQDKLVFNVD